MNNRKAIVAIVITLLVAIAVSGWYIHMIKFDESSTSHLEPEKNQTPTPITYWKAEFCLHHPSTHPISHMGFGNLNGSKLKEHNGECCSSWVNPEFEPWGIAAPESVIKINFRYKKNEPTREDIEEILGDNLTIIFYSYEDMPPIENRVHTVEFCGGKYGGEHDTALFHVRYHGFIMFEENKNDLEGEK